MSRLVPIMVVRNEVITHNKRRDSGHNLIVLLDMSVLVSHRPISGLKARELGLKDVASGSYCVQHLSAEMSISVAMKASPAQHLTISMPRSSKLFLQVVAPKPYPDDVLWCSLNKRNNIWRCDSRAAALASSNYYV